MSRLIRLQLPIVLLASFFSHLCSSAQNAATDTAKCSIGIWGAYDKYLYSFENTDGSGYSNFSYSNRFNYSVGAAFTYRLQERISISALVSISEKGFEKNYLPEYYNSIQENTITSTDYKLYYLGLSPRINYLFKSNGRFIPFASIGGGFAKLISSESNSTFKDGVQSQGSDVDLNFSDWAYFVPVTVGCEISISRHLFVSAAFTAQYNSVHAFVIKHNKPFSINPAVTIGWK